MNKEIELAEKIIGKRLHYKNQYWKIIDYILLEKDIFPLLKIKRQKQTGFISLKSLTRYKF